MKESHRREPPPGAKPWSQLTEDEQRQRLRELYPDDPDPADELALYEVFRERGMLDSQQQGQDRED